uniref:Uncharacterized protein n=1 Tax=Arundo donax TaxID=35708 RepID=A0A0A8YXR0_ARUDO
MKGYHIKGNEIRNPTQPTRCKKPYPAATAAPFLLQGPRRRPSGPPEVRSLTRKVAAGWLTQRRDTS